MASTIRAQPCCQEVLHAPLTDLPVTAVINEVEFQGALVILVERSVDPDAPPLQGATFLDGLTPRECQQVLLWIKPPAGSSLRYRL